MEVNQATVIVGGLLAMFIVYLAMQGRLTAYYGLLTGSTG